jgi:hypothetical protein
MGVPFLAVENFYDSVQFDDAFTIDANEEATGFQAWRVGTGRRSYIDRWKPTTANNLAWLRVDCTAARDADFLALDRGHNLGGKVISLRESTDNFAANNVEVFTATIPTTVSDDTDVDATNGALTPEGSWIKRFTSTSSRYWRLQINAVAAYTPEIVGLWLGEGWACGDLGLPWHDDDLVPRSTNVVLPSSNWRGSGRITRQRIGELEIQLESAADYDTYVARHIRDNFLEDSPMWILYDDERAERAVLGTQTGQRQGFGYEPDTWPRSGRISWIEHQPVST